MILDIKNDPTWVLQTWRDSIESELELRSQEGMKAALRSKKQLPLTGRKRKRKG